MKLHPGYESRPTDDNFVDAEDTPLTEAQAAYYLREGWYNLFGIYPSIDTIAILWAQSALETGRWQHLRNNNWGNIKKNSDYADHYTSYEAGEFLNGKHEMFYPYHHQTFFAAWPTAVLGAEGYINFLYKRERYAKAWVELLAGDPEAYCKELKAGGYFTAPLDKYTAVVVRLVNEFKVKAGTLLAWKPEEPQEPSGGETEDTADNKNFTDNFKKDKTNVFKKTIKMILGRFK